jgi:hypothetical protein
MPEGPALNGTSSWRCCAAPRVAIASRIATCPGWVRPNATDLGCLGWSLAVLGFGWWCDCDCCVGWAAVAVSLSVMGSLGGEVAHFPLDHPGIAAVSTFDVDFEGDLVQEALVVIMMTGEGGKSPVSISWTG